MDQVPEGLTPVEYEIDSKFEDDGRRVRIERRLQRNKSYKWIVKDPYNGVLGKDLIWYVEPLTTNPIYEDHMQNTRHNSLADAFECWKRYESTFVTMTTT